MGESAILKNKIKITKKKKTEYQKLFKALKGGLDNFFDKKSLEYLTFKYRVINNKQSNI